MRAKNAETTPRNLPKAIQIQWTVIFLKGLIPSPSRKVTIKYLLQRQCFKGREASSEPEMQVDLSLIVEGKWERRQVSEDRFTRWPTTEEEWGQALAQASTPLSSVKHTCCEPIDAPSRLPACLEYLRSLPLASGCDIQTHLMNSTE